jgi:hypothetical protein
MMSTRLVVNILCPHIRSKQHASIHGSGGLSKQETLCRSALALRRKSSCASVSTSSATTLNPMSLAHRDDGTDDSRILWIIIYAANERTNDLQAVDTAD